MLVLEYKIKAKPKQYQAIEEAIRTAQFIRNKAIRYGASTRKKKVRIIVARQEPDIPRNT
jgi:hypothetical protein